MPGKGPLPNPNARRRNAPTIPTTSLPVGGRKGAAPKCPYDLAKAGQTWWKWAWHTPQAAAWDDGALYAVARRAQLEDDLALLDTVSEFDLDELLGLENEYAVRDELKWIIGRLRALAGGRKGVVAAMGELDKRLGLDPKAMAELRWKIVDKEGADATKQQPTARAQGARGRLRAV